MLSCSKEFRSWTFPHIPCNILLMAQIQPSLSLLEFTGFLYLDPRSFSRQFVHPFKHFTNEVIVDSVVCAVVDRPLGRSLDFDRFPGCWEVKDSLLLMVGPHAASLMWNYNTTGVKQWQQKNTKNLVIRIFFAKIRWLQFFHWKNHGMLLHSRGAYQEVLFFLLRFFFFQAISFHIWMGKYVGRAPARRAATNTARLSSMLSSCCLPQNGNYTNFESLSTSVSFRFNQTSPKCRANSYGVLWCLFRSNLSSSPRRKNKRAETEISPTEKKTFPRISLPCKDKANPCEAYEKTLETNVVKCGCRFFGG